MLIDIIGDLMNELENLKSKITYENKTIVGVVGLIIGFIFWGIGHPGIGMGDVLLLIFPCIFLIIPNETIKNSKALAIISAIVIILFFLVGISHFFMVLSEYMPLSYMYPAGYVASMVISDVLQIILALYGLFCAFLLTIQTKPNSNVSSSAHIQDSVVRKYDKHCIECGHGLFNNAKFCPGCGAKVQAIPKHEESSLNKMEKDDNHCKKCGYKLDEDDEFCSECGTKVEYSSESKDNNIGTE